MYTQTHTPTLVQTHGYEQTYIHTVETETQCNLGLEPQKPRYIHLRH